MLSGQGSLQQNVRHGPRPSEMSCAPHTTVEESILEASLIESVGEEPLPSPTPTEEALLLSDEPEPQGAQVTIWPE